MDLDTAQLALHPIQEDTGPGSGVARIEQTYARHFITSRSEQGLPDAWIVEFAERVHAWLPGAVGRIVGDSNYQVVSKEARALLFA